MAGRGRFRVRTVKKIIRAKRQRRIGKKLHAVKQFGSRIAPKSLLAILKWYNLYGGPLGNYNSKTNYGVIIESGQVYKRTWNLSSIWNPDIENDNTGTGTKTCYNYKEYQPFYTKYMVRAAKVRMFMQAITNNNGSTSLSVPCTVFFWCDNNPAADVSSIDTNLEAFIQPGRSYKILGSNCYNSNVHYFKRYFKATKVLKRRLDEDEDYGAITTGSNAASGSNPPESANMYFHMLVVNNSNVEGVDMHINFTYDLRISFYTKLWDYLPDAMDVQDPKTA